MLDRWLVPCCILLAFACSAAPRSAPRPAAAVASAEADSAQQPAAAPLLRVGTSGDYAPFSTRDARGAAQGFDVELAEQLASGLGVQLRWVPFRWPELRQQLESGEFDLAMGGVTWQPSRAVLGYMTRAVARGGPCVLGDASARRIAVNRGGILETWARGRFADRELLSVEDNLSLPGLLASGSVGAIVTDNFELRAFARTGEKTQCEPLLSRKVYWVGPRAGRELGERIDTWLRTHSAQVRAAQERWFGATQPLDASAHLADLLARRFAFMPLVGALKAERGLPIEDLAREREVLSAVGSRARELGLPEQAALDLFALLIEQSKRVQGRQQEDSALDLGRQIRPALTELGERILLALTEARAEGQLARLGATELELLSPWLSQDEREALRARLRTLDGRSELAL